MIDWFTVAAQIVNFLILVALLKYFLYGRIVAAMDQRQREIAARWQDAEQQRQAAADELAAARDQHEQLGQQREALLAEMRDEVQQYRQQLTAKVRSEVAEVNSRWADAIQEETDAFLRDLRQRAAEEICGIARHALSDLADADLEQQMVQRFVRNIEQLDQQEREAVITSLQAGQRTAVVQTTRPLPKSLEKSVESALRQHLLKDLKVQFQQSDDVLCGIALHTGTHKLAWDLHDYLATLQQQLQKTLEEETAARRAVSSATAADAENP